MDLSFHKKKITYSSFPFNCILVMRWPQLMFKWLQCNSVIVSYAKKCF